MEWRTNRGWVVAALVGVLGAACDGRPGTLPTDGSAEALDGGPGEAPPPPGTRWDAGDPWATPYDAGAWAPLDAGAPVDASTECGPWPELGRCLENVVSGYCGSERATVDCTARGLVCHEEPVEDRATCVDPSTRPPCVEDADCGTYASEMCVGPTTVRSFVRRCIAGGCVQQWTAPQECPMPAGPDTCLDADRSQHVTGASCSFARCVVDGPREYCGDGCVPATGACADGPAMDWTAMDVDPTGSTNPVCALWGRSDGEVYAAVCASSTYRYDGASWSGTGRGGDYAIDGDASRTCFAGRTRVYCTPVGGAVSTTLPTTSASEYLDVSVSGPAVFASGYSGIHDGLLVRFDADGGVEEFTDPRWARMNAVVARSPTDVWAAGEQDIVAHFDGTSWTTSTTGTRTGWDTGVEWYDIWLDATGEVVLVGEGGRVARRALGASTWVATPTGTGADLRAVWGLSDGDLIAVGQAGVVLRLGATVTRIEVGTGEDMFSVWQAPSGDVFIGSRGYTVTRGH